METVRLLHLVLLACALFIPFVPACSSIPRMSGPPPAFLPPREVAGHPGAVTRLAFSPDGKHLAVGGADNAIRIYLAETWDAERVVGTSFPFLQGVGWNPAGDRLAAIASGGLQVYEFPSGKEIRFVRLSPPPEGGTRNRTVGDPPAFLWSPGGERIAVSGFDDAAIRVYSGAALDEEVALKGHYKAVTSMAWDPEGRHLYSASWDGTVRRWEAASGKQEFLTPNLGPGSIRLGRLDSIGALATMAYGDKAVLVWDIRSGTFGTLRKKVMSPTPLALFRPSRDSRMMALADMERSVWIRDVPDWSAPRVLTAGGTVEDFRWSPDGRYLAGMTAGDPAVTVWNVATGGGVRLWVREEEMTSMDWSPDGRRLITGSRTGKIREWAVAP